MEENFSLYLIEVFKTISPTYNKFFKRNRQMMTATTSELFDTLFEKNPNAKTAEQLFGRLELTEKIDLMRASPDRLQWMAHNTFRTESGEDVEVVQAIAAMCHAEWAQLQTRVWHNKSASRNLSS